MGGGLLKDAVDEAGLGKGSDSAEQKVMIRCVKCRTRNDEDAQFCDHCGARM